MHESRRTNIHRVAKLANVSAMTVTRTFNGSAPVAEKTKAKILKVASELGYRPNIMAQSLRSGKTNSIGLLCSLGGPHDSVGLIRNISIRLMDKGYACHVADSLSDPEIIKQCLADFSSRNIDGLIIELDEKLSENKEIYDLLREISNVIIISAESFDSRFDVLTVDRTQAIREIVDCFATSGRKKIAFLTGVDRGRERVFIEQVKSYNLPCSNDSVMHIADYNNRDKEEDKWNCFVNVLKDEFEGKTLPDALICSADEGAAAIINYLEKNGCKVPQDIAVAGFNNSALALYFRPPLASVERRNLDVAESVTKMLLNRIKNPALPPQHELLEMKFIHRESAG
jgi:DNA-binding LacI/PurR family transcriptional regulator